MLKNTNIPKNGFSSFKAADKQTRIVLNNLGMDDYIIEDTTLETWSIENIKKKVSRPIKKEWISKERYVGLMAHEFGTHGLEYKNGMKTRLKLLAIGLDKYIGASEGKATMREQLAFNSPNGMLETKRFQEYLRRHFSISLGIGYSGQILSFKKVFKIMNAIDTLWQRVQASKNGTSYNKANMQASDWTWDLLAKRTLKGTDGKGGAFYKDAIYLEHNLAYWQLAKQHPGLFQYWDLGKYDLLNPHHVHLLVELGMLEDNHLA